MAKLSAKTRKALPKSDFAGPDRSYPVPDKSHAAVAKSFASRAVNAGRMSKGEEGRIDAKADRVLGSRDGGGRGTIMESRGNGPAPKADAAGPRKGNRGDGGKAGKMDAAPNDRMGPPAVGTTDNRGDGTGGATGWTKGGSNGKGGIASHPNMSHMHNDSCMYKQNY